MARALAVSADIVNPAVVMDDSRLWCKKFVYIIRASRKQSRNKLGQRYKDGGSRIIYIGVTAKLGKGRPSSTLARIAEKAFHELHGVRRLSIHLVKCEPRQHVETWKQLESALIRKFEILFNHRPYYNETSGAKPVARKQFADKRLESVIRGLS